MLAACHAPRFQGRSTSHRQSHHRPRGVGASYLGEARGGEHGRGSGVEGRGRYPGGLESGRVDRMTLDGCRAVLAGELDGGSQEGGSDAGSPVLTADGEAGDPPDTGLIRGEHPRQRLAARNTREAGTGSYPGPSGGMIIDVRDEPRRYHRARDLLVQRVTVVWSRVPSRVLGCCGAEEQLTPAPRRVLAASAEYR